MLRLGASAARAAPSCSFGETVARDDAGYGLEALVSKKRPVPQHRIHPCLPRLAIDRPNPTVQITPYLHLDRPEHGGEQPEWRLLIAVAA